MLILVTEYSELVASEPGSVLWGISKRNEEIMQKFEIDTAIRGFEGHPNPTLRNAIIVKLYDQGLYKVVKEFADKTSPHDFYLQQPAGETTEYTSYYLEYSSDATKYVEELRQELTQAKADPQSAVDEGKPTDIVDDTETTTNRT
jgi:hypothetical protein